MEKASREGMYDLLPESLEIHKSPFRLEMHGARCGEAAQTPAHSISKRGLGREVRRGLCPLE